MTITSDILKAIVPGIKPVNLQVYPALLTQFMEKYEINTPRRAAPFLANLAHESGSFNYTREIASGKAYEGRADLGNTQLGDGMRFKGRGLIQITGRDMYESCSKALYKDERLINTPELLEAPAAATESACWFWRDIKKLNAVADQPDGWVHNRKMKDGSFKPYNRFQWIVMLINGGQNGLAERQAFYERANNVLK